MCLPYVKEMVQFLELVYYQFNLTSPIYIDYAYKGKPYKLVGRFVIFPRSRGCIY